MFSLGLYINILEKALGRFTDMEKNWLNIVTIGVSVHPGRSRKLDCQWVC